MESKSVEATHDQQAQQGALPLAAGSAPIRRRTYPLTDNYGTTYGETPAIIEYFDGNKWLPIPKVCLSRASD